MQLAKRPSAGCERHSRSKTSCQRPHSFEKVLRQYLRQVSLTARLQQCSLAPSMPVRSIRDTSADEVRTTTDALLPLCIRHVHTLSEAKCIGVPQPPSCSASTISWCVVLVRRAWRHVSPQRTLSLFSQQCKSAIMWTACFNIFIENTWLYIFYKIVFLHNLMKRI